MSVKIICRVPGTGEIIEEFFANSYIEAEAKSTDKEWEYLAKGKIVVCQAEE